MLFHIPGVPYISVVDLAEPWLMLVPWLPSHIPHGLLPFSDNMTFTQRIANLLFNIMWAAFPDQLYGIPLNKDVYELYVKHIPDFSSVHQLTSR